jgi:pimeloyl-ACP methyl ester carboxylesterase
MKKTIVLLVMFLAVAFNLSSCSGKVLVRPAESRTFVLVHGSWQAPWVWDVVKSQLEAAGQKVVVVQLPGHGSDTTNPGTITLNAYRDVVVATIRGLTGTGTKETGSTTNTAVKKVILVGHSMAGMVISEVAESIPDQIEKLVYIGAYLPANGQSLLDLANTDGQSLLGKALIYYPATLGVPLDSVDNIFCQDGSAVVKQQLLQHYRDEPVIPFTNKATLTAGNFGKTNKFYIHTLLDHVVGPDLQLREIAAAQIPSAQVFSVNTSHSPFLSHPSEVTSLLLTIASK